MAIYKKKFTEQSVWDAAIERTNDIFDRYDKVAVSFSGGKDSTAVLNIALKVAEERGRLPLDVVFFDEEAIHPPTIEYVERVAADPRIKFYWYCLPVEHRNACSRKQPFWYCWNPEERDIWVRQLPPLAITELKGFKFGMSVPEINDKNLLFANYPGKVIMLLGLRAQESVRRYRIVATSEHDNYISRANPRQHRGFPIYDWTTEDVWVAAGIQEWDYNKTYDVMEKAGIAWHGQRVCPPYGEEPLRGLWLYAECFPDMWHKMINRVHGVATAVRYANTDLYSVGIKDKPEQFATWKLYLDYVIQELYPEKDRPDIIEAVNVGIREHNKKSKMPIPDEEPDIISGCSWKFLCKVAIKGDYKGRTIRSMVNQTGSILEKDTDAIMEASATEAFKQKKQDEFSKRTRTKSN